MFPDKKTTDRLFLIGFVFSMICIGLIAFSLEMYGAVAQWKLFIADPSLWKNYKKLKLEYVVRSLLCLGLAQNLMFDVYLIHALYKRQVLIFLIFSNKSTDAGHSAHLTYKASWIFFLVLIICGLSDIMGIIGTITYLVYYPFLTSDSFYQLNPFALVLCQWVWCAMITDIWSQILGSDLFKLLIRPTNTIKVRRPTLHLPLDIRKSVHEGSSSYNV